MKHNNPSKTDFRRWCENNPNPHTPDIHSTETVETKDGHRIFIEISCKAKTGKRDIYHVAVWIPEEKSHKRNFKLVNIDYNLFFKGEDSRQEAMTYYEVLEHKISNHTLEQIKGGDM